MQREEIGPIRRTLVKVVVLVGVIALVGLAETYLLELHQVPAASELAVGQLNDDGTAAPRLHLLEFAKNTVLSLTAWATLIAAAALFGREIVRGFRALRSLQHRLWPGKAAPDRQV